MVYSVIVKSDRRGKGIPDYEVTYSGALLRDRGFTLRMRKYFVSPRLDDHFMLREYNFDSTNTKVFAIVHDENEIEPMIRERAFEYAKAEKKRLEEYLGVEIDIREHVLEPPATSADIKIHKADGPEEF
ncbi:MAG: hypothetical protein ABH849_02525 [Nanoarchaeota archaeon]